MSHPAKVLHERAVMTILPAIDSFAALKRIPMESFEREPLARFVLEGYPRNKVRAFMRGDETAIREVQGCIDHALDALAVMRLILTAYDLHDIPAPEGLPLLFKALDVLRARSANDSAAMQVWQEPTAMIASHIQDEVARSTKPATVTLPADADIRSIVRLPLAASGQREA